MRIEQSIIAREKGKTLGTDTDSCMCSACYAVHIAQLYAARQEIEALKAMIVELQQQHHSTG